MAIIGVKLGLTLNVGEREFFRPEMSLEGVDTSFPIGPQIEAAEKGLEAVFEATSSLLLRKVSDYLSSKGG